MIQLSTTTAQTLSPGQSLTFNATLLKTGCAEAHRTSSSIVTLRSNCATYELHFSGNVTSTVAGPVSLAITLDGEILPETLMNREISTANSSENIASAVLVRTTVGCCGKVSVTNAGTTPIVVSPNTSFFVKRVA